MMTTSKDEHAIANAKAHLDSIKAMIARIDHAQSCDGEPAATGGNCELTGAEIMDGIGYSGETPTDEQRADYHDEDKAREQLEESPLSLQVRSGWANVGDTLNPEEYEILMTTGGPALRIVGDLDEHQCADSARLQYQDWGIPWTEYITTGDDHEAVMRFAQQFFFGS